MLPEGSAAEALAVRVAIGQEMVRGKNSLRSKKSRRILFWVREIYIFKLSRREWLIQYHRRLEETFWVIVIQIPIYTFLPSQVRDSKTTGLHTRARFFFDEEGN